MIKTPMNNSPAAYPFGPAGFWFLNDHLEPAIIDFQLDEFIKQKFSGVALHPRDGLETPYLSKTWFEALKYIIDGCKKRGLQVWFYDESPFPSGSAGGRLLNQYPNLAAKSLQFHSLTLTPENGQIHAPLPGEGRLFRIFALHLNKKQQLTDSYEDITDYAGPVTDRWYIQGERTKGYGPIFIDDTTNPHWRGWAIHENWMLDWQTDDPGPQQILVVRITKGKDNRHGYYVDLLNPETTRRFIDLTYQTTLERLGRETFKQFCAAFTDEPALCSPYPWTETLPEKYEQTYGENLSDYLPHLTFNIDQRSEQVRHQYRELLAQMWNDNFAKPIARWCKEHDIPFTGHISPEEDPIFQVLITPGLPRLIANMDWPGYDLILSPFGPGEYGKLIGLKLVASISHQQNKEHTLTEALGCSGENLNLQTMRKMIHWLILGGIDKFVFHGHYYSLNGHRKREAPPSIFYQAPYWQLFHKLSDEMSTLCEWAGKGKPHRPIGVLYPTAAFQAWVPVDKDNALKLATDISKLIGSMTAAGLDFDFVTDHDLANATIDRDKGQFKIGSASYETFVLPSVPLVDNATQKTLNRLMEGGIQIESLTPRVQTIGDHDSPTMLPNVSFCIDDLTGKLIKQYRRWAQVPSDRKLYVNSRHIEGQIERLIWNPDDRPLEIIRHLTSNEKETIILPPWQTMCLIESTPIPQLPTFTKDSDAQLESSWTLSPNDPNLLLLSRWQIELQDGSQHIVRLPARSGQLPWDLDRQIVTLWSEFIADDFIDELELWWDRSTFAGPFELRLNGTLLSPAQPTSRYDIHEFRIAIGKFIQPGLNRLEVKVGPITPYEPAMVDPLKLVGWFRVKQTDNQIFGDDAADVRPEWHKAFCVNDPTISRIAPMSRSLVIPQPTDWTKLGFPHYSGTMSYSTNLIIGDDQKQRFLTASADQTDAFEVFVNGTSAGICSWSPFRLELTNFLRKGNNLINIKVANTAVNRIEGKPNPSGLFDSVSITTVTQKEIKI